MIIQELFKMHVQISRSRQCDQTQNYWLLARLAINYLIQVLKNFRSIGNVMKSLEVQRMCFRNHGDPEDDHLCPNIYASSRCTTFTSTKIVDTRQRWWTWGPLWWVLPNVYFKQEVACCLPLIHTAAPHQRSFRLDFSTWYVQEFSGISSRCTWRSAGFDNAIRRNLLAARSSCNQLITPSLEEIVELRKCRSAMNLRWDFHPTAEESWRKFTQSSSGAPYCTFYDRSACDTDEQTWRMWRRLKRNNCYRVVVALLVNVDTEA